MSILMGMIKKLAAGSIFNGYTGDIDIMKMSAKIYWGISFTERPKTLEGYACYKPGAIDWTQDPYKGKEGELDNGHILIDSSGKSLMTVPHLPPAPLPILSTE